MAGSCNYGNEPSDAVKVTEFVGPLIEYRLLKTYSALWSKSVITA
jgi:hypothetical protein